MGRSATLKTDPASDPAGRSRAAPPSRGLSLLFGCYGERGLQMARRSAEGTWASEPMGAGARNISFACWSRRTRKLYAVREEQQGAIEVIAPDEGWRLLASVPSGGAEPCHCAIDASGQFLAVANYGSGGVVVFALDPEGMPQPNPWQYKGELRGPNPDRQDGPHAHWVGFSPDQRWLVQTDLGGDVVRAFRFDSRRGIVGEMRQAFTAPAGTGPRWIEFGATGGDAFLVSELASTISLLGWTDGALREKARQLTRAAGTSGANSAGHLAVNTVGNRLYVSNRGDDTVSVLAVENGRLDLLRTVPSGGKSPRFLCLLEDRQLLFVGHEEAGPVTVFEVAGVTPRRLGQIDIEKVAWISRWPAGAPATDASSSIPAAQD